MSAQEKPWWLPEAYAARRPALLARAALLRRMRDWFHGEGFVEVETPALQVAAGMEVHVAPFETALSEPDGRSRALRLHSSPEFAMKKLLVAGEPRLFQFARVFRNGERSATHHPEFTLLEWYRAGAGWRDLVPDCEALLALAGPELRWNGRRVPTAAPFERLSVAAAFRDRLGLDVLAADTGRLAAACRAEGLEPGGRDGWEDLFFRLFLNRIEPHLGLARPTVLHGWPARMAALARLDPDDPQTAERFEVYVGGLELANAFGELTDAAEQRRRFEAAASQRRALHGDDLPLDEDFLSALEHGMPAAAGIALGFDRLAMLATGVDRIEDVLWAPVAAAEDEGQGQGAGRMNAAGMFVWNELMTPDVEGAKAFYGKLFGWEGQTTPMPGPDGAEYTGFMLGGGPVGGALAPPEPGIPPHWMPYVRVEDADAAEAAAVEAGGQVCRSAFDVPQVGRIAVLQDPAGAVFAVIAPAPELLAGG